MAELIRSGSGRCNAWRAVATHRLAQRERHGEVGCGRRLVAEKMEGGRGALGRAAAAGLIVGLAVWPASAANRVAPGAVGQERLEAPSPAEETTCTSASPSAVAAVGADGQRSTQDPFERPSVARSPRTVERTVGAGAATSVELFHARGGTRYAVQTVAWARDITGEHGPGVVRGRLAWVVELVPVLVEAAPSRIWGAGVAPLGLRWSTRDRKRWSAFTEVAGGALGSSRTIPDGAARFNFTAHWGAGLRVPVMPSDTAVVAYRIQHISNGNRLSANPDVNSHVVFLGWSRARRR